MRQPETNLSLTRANGHSAAALANRAAELAPDTFKYLIRSLKQNEKCYRKQLRKCQRKVSERAIHDLRVEARRLLSLLDLLSPFVPSDRVAKAQAALKCQLDTFDDLRDIQVQLPAVRKFRSKFPAARDFYRFLEKRESRLCRSSRKQARKLRNRRVSNLIDACRFEAKAWLEDTGWEQANLRLVRAVGLAFAATRKLRDNIDPKDTHSIHCTRIAFKEFRYMLEALAPHLPWAGKSFLECLLLYQGLMGEIQDAEVLRRRFDKFIAKEKIEARPAAQFAQELFRRRRRLIETYLSEADRLLEFWPSDGARTPVGSAAAVQSRKGSGQHQAESAAATHKRKAL